MRDNQVLWERPVVTLLLSSIANDNAVANIDRQGDTESNKLADVVEVDCRNADAGEIVTNAVISLKDDVSPTTDNVAHGVDYTNSNTKERHATYLEWWADLINHASRTLYYYHKGEHVTTWERPVANQVGNTEIPEIALVDANAPKDNTGAT